MDKSLLIVESPAKAKTINKYLGKKYVVEASVGHIKNLPKSKLGVDVDHDYAPTFETIEGKEEIVEKLRDAASKAKEVYIATDPDREGEAIAADIAEEIAEKNNRIHRVLFHEITERGITEAMQHPRAIDDRLVASQRARRVMDRIVGYKVSPLVWKTFFYGLSAGRVQSVALRLICEREEEIRAFVSTEYWSIVGEFKTHTCDPFAAKLFKIAGKELITPSKENLTEMTHKGTQEKYTYIQNEAEAQKHIEDVKRQTFSIASVQKRETRRNPWPPFITSTMQQEASRKLYLSASRTMKLAQKLYEGIELGPEGSVGLITYMRTDSTRLSDDAVAAVREYIYNNYGKEYVPAKPHVYKKKKTSQDAHEAIRPTSVKYTPAFVKKYLDKDLFRLYELIWNRFVACQMEAALLETTTVIVEGGQYQFKATASQYKFRGFLQVYDDASDKDADRDADEAEMANKKLSESLAEGQSTQLISVISNRHETSPPPRYTESSLVKTLEALGIGRPSTYAMIVGTIIDRKYVEQQDRKLYALDLGLELNRMLTTHFSQIFNVRFTAKMEEELDTIASGKNDYKTVLDDFYLPFHESLEKVSKKAPAIKKSLQVETDEVCELCGKSMLIKWGRNGRFMACSGYPACKNTHPLPEDQEKLQHLAGLKCELCGGNMLVRSSKFGTFLGCSNYPKCTNTKPISMGIKCPKCKDGEVIERKTKRKRTFYGCSRYPGCDFASWDKPIDRQCDTCGSPYMVVKYSQKRGEYLKCPSCKAEIEKTEAPAVAMAG
ncbi:MAG: type I DNA topoisomerase [Ignavibacteriae bacterium]|nr:type I DNA topoisomerase [Ignavibacteria bacterium]MBI3364857.1 type I DNA topoisomerase [Ignavibacteriota bacterium]